MKLQCQELQIIVHHLLRELALVLIFKCSENEILQSKIF